MTEAPLSEALMTDHWWWRPGWRVGRRMYTWHVTQEDQPAVIGLAGRYQRALERFGSLDPVPAEWLHLTVQGVGFADEVTAGQVAAVRDAVAGRLAGFGPIRAEYGGAAVFRESVLLSPSDPAPFDALWRAIRAGVADVLGAAPGAGDHFWPHISVAYSNAVADPAPIRAAVDAVTAELTTTARTAAPADAVGLAATARPARAEPVTAGPASAGRAATTGFATAIYRKVSLIAIHRDNRRYEWEPVAAVPLS